MYPDKPNNRQWFERLFLKTLYLDNMSADEMRGILQQLLNNPGKQIAVLKEHNAIVARAALADLKVLEPIIALLDKMRTEVLLAVDFYGVSQNTSSGQQGKMPLPSQATSSTETATTSTDESATTTETSSATTNLSLQPNYNSLMQSRGNTRPRVTAATRERALQFASPPIRNL